MGVINTVNLCNIEPCRSLHLCKKCHFKIFWTCKSSQQRYFVCSLNGFERCVYLVFTESVLEFHSNTFLCSHLVKIRDLLGGLGSRLGRISLEAAQELPQTWERAGSDMQRARSCSGTGLSVQGCDALSSNWATRCPRVWYIIIKIKQILVPDFIYLQNVVISLK